jgi:succinate-semialdehyde dehydrogenase/glutarate-semialdehyde dehydrogenase
VGLRPVALELGSISGTIVCADADLERAAPRCVSSAFRRAGQVCTSTQRLFVEDAVFDRFISMLVDATKALTVGDPRDPETAVGPMVSEAEARRAEQWIAEAVQEGARSYIAGPARCAARSDDSHGTGPEMKVM